MSGLSQANRDPTTVATRANEVGSPAKAGGVEAAAKRADVVIFAVPYGNMRAGSAPLIHRA